MKQVVQSLRTGTLSVSEVPPPSLRPQGVLVRTVASLVSAGTERMLVEFAGKNLLQKARSRPDLVRRTLDKARREGALNAIDGVRARLDRPLPLGYSLAGSVVAVGSEASEFRVGDRVACAGAGYANHAEQVYVPRNLVVRLPDNVTFEAGAFAALGAIALQGIRQAEVTLGHHVAVIGLGLVGQLSVSLLRAAGCRVFGVEPNVDRLTRALAGGAHAVSTPDQAEAAGHNFTGGHGFDAILITAGTHSDQPVALAGALARDRAIIVALGAVGMHIPRKVYYDKELDFRLSRSYGPGRNDPTYEEKGHDYPYAYVRWTEQRNMQAFIELLASGTLDAAPLITHRIPIEAAPRAYDLIAGKADEPSLGVLLTYNPAGAELPRRITLQARPLLQAPIRVGVVGAGNFANGVLLPALREVPSIERVGIVSGAGLSARHAAERFGFAYCASDLAELLADPQINWLAITTRHDLHASQAIAAMQAGKDVFVEKPLALNRTELTDVLAVQQETGRRLMVGFNRRFAPMVQEMRRFVEGHQRALVALYRVNAGMIPAEHWTQDPAVGGGRIIGEVCHFIDLLSFLLGALPIRVYTAAARSTGQALDDEVVITLHFADGSVGTIIYAAGGDPSYGKERIEIIGDRKVAVLDDFRALELITDGKRTHRRERLRPDKGHRGEWQALATAAQNGSPTPIGLEVIQAVHLAAYAAVESLRTKAAIDI